MPSADKYTNPELRDQVKKEIQDSDKGGAPGQWSARKAQFMAAEYKKRGGDYTTDKETGQDESQQNLSKWTEEEWQTKEGSGNAKQDDGTQKRYLPKKAWEQMDDDEKESTDQKKQHESKQGKQFVGNTDKAKEARKNANEDEAEQFEEKKTNGQAKQSKTNGNAKPTGTSKNEPSSTSSSGGRQAKAAAKKDMSKENYDPKDIDMEDDDEEEEEPADDDDFAPDGDDDPAADEDEDMEDVDDPDDKAAIDGQEAPAGNPDDDDAAAAEGLASGDDDDDAVAGEVDDDNDEAGEKEDSTKPADGQKRPAPKRAASSGVQKGSQKAQKDNSGDGKAKGTVGSKHDKDEAPAQAGSADRLPKKGQRVTWKALPGFVHGKVLEVVTENKSMEGKSIKASKDDPKIALEADSGKFCVHKPDAMYYD